MSFYFTIALESNINPCVSSKPLRARKRGKVTAEAISHPDELQLNSASSRAHSSAHLLPTDLRGRCDNSPKPQASSTLKKKQKTIIPSNPVQFHTTAQQLQRQRQVSLLTAAKVEHVSHPDWVFSTE